MEMIIKITMLITMIGLFFWCFYTVIKETNNLDTKGQEKSFKPLVIWFFMTCFLFIAFVVFVFRTNECPQYEVIQETVYRLKQ